MILLSSWGYHAHHTKELIGCFAYRDFFVPKTIVEPDANCLVDEAVVNIKPMVLM